jgi:hypothetical protein
MTISRRKFIVAGGAVMALPALPSLAVGAKTKAMTPAKKLVMMYVPNGLVRRGFFPGEERVESPGFRSGFDADKEKGYRVPTVPGIHPLELTSTMQPLKAHAKDITFVTGMDRTFKNGRTSMHKRHPAI